MQHGEDALTALGQGGKIGPVALGLVRVAVVGSVVINGMSHMARRDSLDALLSSSHWETADASKPKNPSHGLYLKP